MPPGQTLQDQELVVVIFLNLNHFLNLYKTFILFQLNILTNLKKKRVLITKMKLNLSIYYQQNKVM